MKRRKNWKLLKAKPWSIGWFSLDLDIHATLPVDDPEIETYCEHLVKTNLPYAIWSGVKGGKVCITTMAMLTVKTMSQLDRQFRASVKLARLESEILKDPRGRAFLDMVYNQVKGEIPDEYANQSGS